MKDELIIIKQLPIIEQQLKSVSAEIEARIQNALSLPCTDGTVKQVKSLRAELNKEKEEFECRRREVKKAVMAPYEEFEGKYKEYISDKYRNADKELKRRIDEVEDNLKSKKRNEIESYFNEYLASKNIDFVTFEAANINITLSASVKSLKEQAKEFIDGIYDALMFIYTREDKDELLYEYKQTLNLSRAMYTVASRQNAIREAQAAAKETEEKNKLDIKTVENVEAVIGELKPPEAEDIADNEIVYTMTFTVSGTKNRLKLLKEYLMKEGYINE
ncbi:MAG: DUF1351 domain-containing protein [Monoglobaceae bacterium]